MKLAWYIMTMSAINFISFTLMTLLFGGDCCDSG